MSGNEEVFSFSCQYKMEDNLEMFKNKKCKWFMLFTFRHAEAQLLLLPGGEGGLQRLGHLLVGARGQWRHLRWDVCNKHTKLYEVFFVHINIFYHSTIAH